MQYWLWRRAKEVAAFHRGQSASARRQAEIMFSVPALPYEIAPAAVKSMLDAGEAVALIDVREVSEYQIARIDGAELIPMNTVPQRLQHLDALAEEKLLVVYCHHGMRSLNVAAWLRKQGVENCQSMAGGIELWSREIDPSVPRY